METYYQKHTNKTRKKGAKRRVDKLLDETVSASLQTLKDIEVFFDVRLSPLNKKKTGY